MLVPVTNENGGGGNEFSGDNHLDIARGFACRIAKSLRKYLGN